jgi:DNA-binding beta-propeller fold protein YncE
MRRFVVLGLVGALAFTSVGSPASRAATIASSWPVGQAPFGLTFDSNTGKVYVANSETALPDGTGRVSVVDPGTGSVGTLRTSLTANFVVADVSGRRLYSSNGALSGSAASVDVFDLDSGAAVVPPLDGVGGLALALDRAAGLLFAGGHRLTVVDTGTNTAVGTPLPPPSGGAWFGVAVDPSEARLYLTNADPNAPGLYAYDYDGDGNLTPAATDPRVALGTAVRYAIAVDSVRHLVFAAGSDTSGGSAPSAFYVIDPDTLGVIHTTTIGGFPTGIALAPSTNRIYVSVDSSLTSGAVYVLNDATFAVTETIPLQGFAPGAPLMHSDGRLYVGNYNRMAGTNSTLVALEPKNHAPVIRSFAVSASIARTNDTLTTSVDAFDPDLRVMGAPDPTTFSYEWLRNGTVITGETGSTLDLKVPNNGDRGDTIMVRLTASDGQLISVATREVFIEDTPQLVSVELSNPAPRTNESLIATVVVDDPDDESWRCALAYSVNGALLFEVPTCRYTYSLSVHDYGDKGDVISVRATVTEQFGRWQSVATATATVADSAPAIAGLTLNDTSPASRDILVATVSTYDVDGDAITVTYEWMVNGVTRRTSTSSASTDTFDLGPKGNGDNGDAITVNVVASAGSLTSSTWSASATVTPGRKR